MKWWMGPAPGCNQSPLTPPPTLLWAYWLMLHAVCSGVSDGSEFQQSFRVVKDMAKWPDPCRVGTRPCGGVMMALVLVCWLEQKQTNDNRNKCLSHYTNYGSFNAIQDVWGTEVEIVSIRLKNTIFTALTCSSSGSSSSSICSITMIDNNNLSSYCMCIYCVVFFYHKT